MQKATEEEVLSLEEKMHLAIRDQANTKGSDLFSGLIFVLIFLVAVSTWNISSYLEVELTDELLVLMQENSDAAKYVSSTLLVIFGALYLIEKIYSKMQIKKYSELIDGFIRKSYLINFETAIPKGTNKVKKILNEAIKVFPELKETKRDAEKKGNKLQYEINRKFDDSVYDLSLETKSDGFFLIKFIEEQSFEELEKIVKNTNSYFKDNMKVFRLICVGTDFESIIQDHSVEERMDNLQRKFKLDLILEYDKGYSMVWID